MIKEYIEYLKDNPQGYWFKRKLFGWGWTPARWQGWVAIAIYIALLVFIVSRVEEVMSGREVLVEVIVPVAIITALLIIVSYLKGEKPKWQWGIPKKD